jgi:hypothetical protein
VFQRASDHMTDMQMNRPVGRAKRFREAGNSRDSYKRSELWAL